MPLLADALQRLMDDITALRDAREMDRQEIAALRLKLASLESLQEQDTNRICRDIAIDRQRLKRLEKAEPQPLQRDRGEILRALIVANGGKMLAKDARQKMHLSKPLFSMLLATMDDHIEIKPLHSDNRRKVLILR